MRNEKKVSLLYKFLQACCESCPHVMFVLEIVHRSQSNHNKVIYMNFLSCLQVYPNLKAAVHGRT